jgi:hypothetical protein
LTVAECQYKHRLRGYLLKIIQIKEGYAVQQMTREEIRRRLDDLAREYVATHNPAIVKELYELAVELEKMEKESLN